MNTIADAAHQTVMTEQTYTAGELFLNDGSCLRFRPECRNHVWIYDFVENTTMDGKKIRFLNILYKHTY